MNSRTVKVFVTINNVPDQASLYRYTVVRRAEDGQLWYYGTYREKWRAENAVSELSNGILVEVTQW